MKFGRFPKERKSNVVFDGRQVYENRSVGIEVKDIKKDAKNK